MPVFEKKVQWAWPGGLKKPQSKVFRVPAKLLSIYACFCYFSTKVPMFFFDFLQKQHIYKKSGSWVIAQKPLKQMRMQDFLNFNISQKNLRYEVEFLDMTRGPGKY